jgi:hypothetical protein
MTKVDKKFTTHSRLITDVLNKYKNTYYAFKEIVNNALQASASEIYIDIDYTDEITISPFSYINIRDNGIGVSASTFDNRILQIATDNKEGGEGVGRFALFQLGNLVRINTLAHDSESNSFTHTTVSFDTKDFEQAQVDNIPISVDVSEVAGEDIEPFYEVSIRQLYHGRSNIKAKNKLHSDLLEDNLPYRLFQDYLDFIFNKNIRFYINEKLVDKTDYIIGDPEPIIKDDFIDSRGDTHKLYFTFYNIKSEKAKVSIFIQSQANDFSRIIGSFNFTSRYHTPDLGAWFIYLHSPFIDDQTVSNMDLGDLTGPDTRLLKSMIKHTVDEFFSDRNKVYESFLQKLKKEEIYQKSTALSASDSQKMIFNKTAYLLEQDYGLLAKAKKIRTIVYPLLNRAIMDRDLEHVLEEINLLPKDKLVQFRDLVDHSEISDVIHFSHSVAEKVRFLDFLHDIVYGHIASIIKERSQLHKILENELWLFGESYANSFHLFSDKSLRNNLITYREKHMTTDDDDIDPEGLNDPRLNLIPDLYFFNEKKLDSDVREIMVVELKAPSCSIGKKEVDQIDNYAYAIESQQVFPKHNHVYKLILISSKMTKQIESKAIPARKRYPNDPFFFDEKADGKIKIYLMTWSDLIAQHKNRLSYLAQSLDVKDKLAQDIFEENYPNLIDDKTKAKLTKIK